MFCITKNSRIRYDNTMQKRYKKYLDNIDNCRTCKYYDSWDTCDLNYPDKRSQRHECPGYKLDKWYKKAIKYMDKKMKRSGQGHDKNKIN